MGDMASLLPSTALMSWSLSSATLRLTYTPSSAVSMLPFCLWEETSGTPPPLAEYMPLNACSSCSMGILCFFLYSTTPAATASPTEAYTLPWHTNSLFQGRYLQKPLWRQALGEYIRTGSEPFCEPIILQSATHRRMSSGFFFRFIIT